MNDLIQRLVNGVIRQEGKHPGAVNPGDLRGAPWIKNPEVQEGFWVPDNGRPEGVAGLAHVVALHIAQGNSLTDFIAGHPGVYAGFSPGADHNDPASYIANLQQWCGITNAAAPLRDYLGE